MPHCQQVDKKMWYLYTMEFSSATKKNEILLFTNKRMDLINIILNEVSQAQESQKSHVLPIYGLQT
jgi:hypothetical protein